MKWTHLSYSASEHEIVYLLLKLNNNLWNFWNNDLLINFKNRFKQLKNFSLLDIFTFSKLWELILDFLKHMEEKR